MADSLTTGSDNLSDTTGEPNPLDDFQSFNNLFTLAGCTRVQTQGNINKSDINNIICRSQSIGPDGGVDTSFGKFDYFIDDVTIITIPKINKEAGVGFATKLTFKVFEPYSMGLFMLALKTASNESGYNLNYNEAPYVFMIEWIGYVDGYPGAPDDKLTRILPIKIIDVKFSVGITGSTYEVTAIPYNEIAFRENVVKNVSDIQISGKTVKEMLVDGPNSLFKQLQLRQQQEKDLKHIDDLDDIEIQFPANFTVPIDRAPRKISENEIGNADIYTDFNNPGSQPFANLTDIFINDKQIYKSSVYKLEPDRSWHFTQEISIPDIISEVVIRSTYITKQFEGNKLKVDKNGMVEWFRVETRVEDEDKDISQLGRQKRKIVYRVLPYAVHSFRFLPPGKKPDVGFRDLKSSVSKVYDYIYTGKNTEIIDVKINFDMAFFTAVPADVATNVGHSNPGQKGITAGGKDPDRVVNYGVGASPATSGGGASPATSGGGSTGRGTSLTTPAANLSKVALPGSAEGEPIAAQAQSGLRQFQYAPPGGGGTDTGDTSKVRTMQILLGNDADMINLDMTIMGDPYYIPSSGMGSQSSDMVSSFKLEDGSMNYQRNEVMIVLNFRTPVDFDPATGLYRFEKTIDMWSGLYLLTQVESKFYQNKFTQVLQGIRLRNQVGGENHDTIFIKESGQQGGGQPDTGQGQQQPQEQPQQQPDTGVGATPKSSGGGGTGGATVGPATPASR